MMRLTCILDKEGNKMCSHKESIFWNSEIWEILQYDMYLNSELFHNDKIQEALCCDEILKVEHEDKI